jgi:hypothetical protein
MGFGTLAGRGGDADGESSSRDVTVEEEEVMLLTLKAFGVTSPTEEPEPAETVADDPTAPTVSLAISSGPPSPSFSTEKSSPNILDGPLSDEASTIGGDALDPSPGDPPSKSLVPFLGLPRLLADAPGDLEFRSNMTLRPEGALP